MGTCGDCWAGLAPRPRSRSVVRHANVAEWYALGDVLGSGAVGTVRRACSKKGSDIVAVKSIRITDDDGTSLLSPEEFQQLMTEIQITFECRHPNLITTYAAFLGAATLDIVMELASGGEVAATFAEAQSHSEQKAQAILQQVCAGLAYLHERSIAHRDVKPENVMYTDERQEAVKLVDFGTAKRNMGDVVGRRGEPYVERRNTLVGTAPFMAPELFQPAGGCALRFGDQCVAYSHAVDMWAVGVFAFLVLFGSLPIAPQGRFFADFKHGMQEDWHFPSELAEDFSSDALDFITACLQRDAARRITAASALQHPWLSRPASGERLRHFEAWRRNVRRSLGKRHLAGAAALAAPTPGPAGPQAEQEEDAPVSEDSGMSDSECSSRCHGENGQTTAIAGGNGGSVPACCYAYAPTTVASSEVRVAAAPDSISRPLLPAVAAQVASPVWCPRVAAGELAAAIKGKTSPLMDLYLELEELVGQLQRAEILAPQTKVLPVTHIAREVDPSY